MKKQKEKEFKNIKEEINYTFNVILILLICVLISLIIIFMGQK